LKEKQIAVYSASKMQVTNRGECYLKFQCLSVLVVSHSAAKQWWWLSEADGL